MGAFRTIHKVTGPTLTVAVPLDFAGKQVEVVIQPVEISETPERAGIEPRHMPYLLRKPPLTEEDRKLCERNPYPLRGTGGELIDPFAPAFPEDDWEVYRDDPA